MRSPFSLVFMVFIALTMAFTGIVQAAEAPMLAEMVKAGKLPPLEQRLPSSPFVEDRYPDIGKYGGTLHDVWRGDNVFAMNRFMVEGLVKYRVDTGEYVPNLAESWEFQDGGKTVIFKLRKGIKWSDGQPYTAEDWVFYWEHILNDKNITASLRGAFIVDGEPWQVKKLDDYTLQFSFPKPYGMFLHVLSSFSDLHDRYPAHKAKELHPAFNKSTTDYKALASSIVLTRSGTDSSWPTLGPWMPEEHSEGVRAMLVRNPYYWKVDKAGNQLPYIDRLEFAEIKEVQVIQLRFLAGLVDFDMRYQDMTQRSSLIENQKSGGYRAIPGDTRHTGLITFMPNLTHLDEEVRGLYLNRDFREAISHALDREEVIEIALDGVGRPWPMMPPKGDPLYHPDAEKYMHLYEYDPEKSRQTLDSLGVVDKDGDGFRELPSGKKWTIRLDAENAPHFIKAGELFVEYFAEVGLKAVLKQHEGIDRSKGNQDWIIRQGGSSHEWIPTGHHTAYKVNSRTWPLHVNWLRGREPSLEPTPLAIKIQDLHDKMTGAETIEGVKAAGSELLLEVFKELVVYGIAAGDVFLAPVSNKLGNVPDPLPWESWPYPTVYRFYFKE